MGRCPRANPRSKQVGWGCEPQQDPKSPGCRGEMWNPAPVGDLGWSRSTHQPLPAWSPSSPADPTQSHSSSSCSSPLHILPHQSSLPSAVLAASPS